MHGQEAKPKVVDLSKKASLSKKIISKMALIVAAIFLLTVVMSAVLATRSEERRVGKECEPRGC